MRKQWMCVLLAVVLSHLVIGCVPLIYAMKEPQELRQEKTKDLCLIWYSWGTDSVLQELKRRNQFNGTDWALIKQKQIRVGMNADAVYCSWGNPSRENYATWRRSTQLVYSSKYQRYYVYVENGQVSGFSN